MQGLDNRKYWIYTFSFWLTSTSLPYRTSISKYKIATIFQKNHILQFLIVLDFCPWRLSVPFRHKSVHGAGKSKTFYFKLLFFVRATPWIRTYLPSTNIFEPRRKGATYKFNNKHTKEWSLSYSSRHDFCYGRYIPTFALQWIKSAAKKSIFIFFTFLISEILPRELKYKMLLKLQISSYFRKNLL